MCKESWQSMQRTLLCIKRSGLPVTAAVGLSCVGLFHLGPILPRIMHYTACEGARLRLFKQNM